MNSVFKFIAVVLVAIGGLDAQAMHNKASDKTAEGFWRIVSNNGYDDVFSSTKRSDNDVDISSDLQFDFLGSIYVDRNDVTENGQKVLGAISCIYLRIAQELLLPNPEQKAQWAANDVYAIICGRHHIKADPNTQSDD